MTGRKPVPALGSAAGAAGAVGRCPQCGRPVSVDRVTAAVESWQVRSACCDRWTVLHGVQGVRDASRACGEHCTTAHGRTCRCECGGASHGIAWRVRSASSVAPFELVAAEVAPVRELAPLQPLDGIRWPVAEMTPASAREGQVALFDVADPGELQKWGRRG